MKNVDCYRLGNMLYLDIQKGEEAMKTSEFQKYIGGIATFIEVLEMDT